MSNFLAIATVTATLRQLLQAAVGMDVPGALVTTARPDTLDNGTPTTAVNVYLYEIAPNAALRNADLPTRRVDGQIVRRPQAALDLYYLLSFLGNETQLEPQRLLGSVVRTLHAAPVLTRPLVEATIASVPFLAGSDLADAVETVKLTPIPDSVPKCVGELCGGPSHRRRLAEFRQTAGSQKALRKVTNTRWNRVPIPLSLEELSKLWSVFFQTPYTLSIAYQASVVLIEGPAVEAPPAPLVREPHIVAVPIRESPAGGVAAAPVEAAQPSGASGSGQ